LIIQLNACLVNHFSPENPFHSDRTDHLSDVCIISRKSILNPDVSTMGCQTAIVEKIKNKRADYVLALKKSRHFSFKVSLFFKVPSNRY